MSDKKYQQPRSADNLGSDLGDENSFMKYMMSDEGKGARERLREYTARLLKEGAESGMVIENDKREY